MLARFTILGTLLLAAPAHAAECGKPVALRFDVTDKIVRSEVGFTQGLEWRDGKLYESTGAVGDHSGLNTIAPDGKVTNLLDQGEMVRHDSERLADVVITCAERARSRPLAGIES